MTDDPAKKSDWMSIGVAVVTVIIAVVGPMVNSARERAITDLQLQQQTTLNQVYFREMERIKDKADMEGVANAKLEQRVEDDERLFGLKK